MDYPRFRSRLVELQSRLPEVRETAESADGLITVTLGARGELLALELDPRIYRTTDAAALAQDILDTVRRAADAVRERVKKLTTEAFGESDTGDDPAFGPVLGRLERMAR
jgi:DNA-binding protein YbaB